MNIQKDFDLNRYFKYVFLDEKRGNKDFIRTTEELAKEFDLKYILLDDQDDFATDGANRVLEIAKNHKIIENQFVYGCDFKDYTETDESDNLVAIFYKTEY